MTKEKIKTGIEIECVINSSILNVDQGGYHNGNSIDNLPGWTAERDSSLRTEGYFNEWGESVEFVSKILDGKKSFEDGLKSFQIFCGKNGRYELNEVLNFNDSCGSHLHFSINNFTFNKKVIFEIFPKVRKHFLNKISKSNIASKEDIKDQYNRHYARNITKENWKQGDRYREFNFESEYEGQGLEWRSLNMLNIKTWDEFFEFWKIVYDSVEYLLKISTKYSKIYYEKVIDKVELSRLKYMKKANSKQAIILNIPKRNKSYSRLKSRIDFFEGGEIECAI